MNWWLIGGLVVVIGFFLWVWSHYLEGKYGPKWVDWVEVGHEFRPIFSAICPDHGPYKTRPHGIGYLRCTTPDCFYEVPAPKIQDNAHRLIHK